MSGIADPFTGHIDEFRIPHIQRSDGWIETTWEQHERSSTAGQAILGIQAIDQAYVPFFGVFAAWDDAMVARRSANPLAMLWPEMDAQLVAHQLRRGRPVVIVAGS